MEMPSMLIIEAVRGDDGDVEETIFKQMALAVPRSGDLVYTPPSEEQRQDFWTVSRVEWEFGQLEPGSVQRVNIWLIPVVFCEDDADETP